MGTVRPRDVYRLPVRQSGIRFNDDEICARQAACYFDIGFSDDAFHDRLSPQAAIVNNPHRSTRYGGRWYKQSLSLFIGDDVRFGCHTDLQGCIGVHRDANAIASGNRIALRRDLLHMPGEEYVQQKRRRG